MLYKREELEDIGLIEKIAGVQFKEIPKIYLVSEKVIRKKVMNSDKIDVEIDRWEVAMYDAKENEIYLNKNWKKRDPYLFDFEKAHELGHALFRQHSVALNQLPKDYEHVYIFLHQFDDQFFDYLLGKVDLEYPEKWKELLNELTLEALSQGFANLMARFFLIKKYGMKEGFIKGVEKILYDHKLIESLPPSLFKIKAILLASGPMFANHYFDIQNSQDVCRYFLSISEEDLPKVREEMRKLHSRCLKVGIED
jgi:hypothetical protein